MNKNIKLMLELEHPKTDELIYDYLNTGNPPLFALTRLFNQILDEEFPLSDVEDFFYLRLKQLKSIKKWYFDIYEGHHNVYHRISSTRTPARLINARLKTQYIIESTNLISHEFKKIKYHLRLLIPRRRRSMEL